MEMQQSAVLTFTEHGRQGLHKQGIRVSRIAASHRVFGNASFSILLQKAARSSQSSTGNKKISSFFQPAGRQAAEDDREVDVVWSSSAKAPASAKPNGTSLL